MRLWADALAFWFASLSVAGCLAEWVALAKLCFGFSIDGADYSADLRAPRMHVCLPGSQPSRPPRRFIVGCLPLWSPGIAGYVGMWVAVRSNIRVASAATRSLSEACRQARHSSSQACWPASEPRSMQGNAT